MKSGSMSPPQPGHMPSSPSLRSIARISSSRSRTSSRYSGGRRIVYTSAPTNGNTSAVTIETPTSTGSSTRRLASLYVQNTSASQSTPTKNSTSSTMAWNVLELKKSETPPSGLSLVSVAARGRLMDIRIGRFGRRRASPLDDRLRERVADGVEDRDREQDQTQNEHEHAPEAPPAAHASGPPAQRR